MLLLTNATIHTQDPKFPVAGAIAVNQGRVISVGTREQLETEFRDLAEFENMEGRTILPGLTDAHIHLQHYALGLQKVDCETRTLDECLRRVADRAASAPPGAWILGHGWQQTEWADCTGGTAGFPSAQMLDAISDRHPIYLTAKSLHAGWANSSALAAAGLTGSSSDPPDGALQRESSGALTGILLEGAMRLVAEVVPPVSEHGLQKALLRAQERLWELGLTGVHDFDRRACFSALQQLHSAGTLKLRVVKNIPVEDLEHALGIGLRSGFGDAMLRIGNVKAFADGALGPRTAAMLQPYENEPENRGMLLLDREALFEFGAEAARGGLGMTVHAIGDAANHEVIEAYARLRAFEREEGLAALRHRIEHVQVLHPTDVGRLADLDIIASMQPIHATSDMHAADRYWGARSDHAYAWRSLLSAGTRLAFGSDAPVESPNPFWGLHAAVTRRRADGSPGPDGWRGSQKLERGEALAGYTTGAAYTAGMEGQVGVLKAGAAADLIVLEDDFFEVAAENIRKMRPLRTMVAGEWVLLQA